MIQTTTPGVDGRAITEYLGVVTGEASARDTLDGALRSSAAIRGV